MKIWKLNCVKMSMGVTIVHACTSVLSMSVLSLIVVDSVHVLVINACMVIFLYALKHITYAWNERALAVGNYYLKMLLNHWIDAHIAQMNYTSFMKKDSGEHAAIYVNDIPKINNLIFNRFVGMIFNMTMIICILIALLYIHWVMFIMGICMIVVMFGLPKLYQSKLSKAILDSQSSQEKFLSRMGELMLGFSTFLEQCAFPMFHKKSREVGKTYAKSICDIDSFAGRMSAVIDFSGAFISTLSLVVLSYYVIQNQMSAGALLSTISLMPALGDAVSNFISQRVFYHSGKQLFEEKFKDVKMTYEAAICKPFFFKDFNENIEMTSCKPVQSIQTIEVKDVCVNYHQKNIIYPYYRFERGKTYVIVGTSGSGKSTLLKLILGEVQAYEGDVIIDGRIKQKHENLFDCIAYVGQQTFLLNDTLLQNITLGKDVPLENVQQIVTRMAMTEFSLEDRIYENGKNLSGGQRQRIALARAIIQDKPIIILDEATANLDKETTLFIERYVLQLPKTVIMISHHLHDEVLPFIDEIVEIKQG